MSDQQNPKPAYVQANLRAHVIQDDMYEWDTTVVAFRLNPEMDSWPTPILLDSTDSESDNVFVFIEDQGKWTAIGDRTCDNLDAARDAVRKRLEERAKLDSKIVSATESD
jgi:hypothetical protein